jgi:hypothetical protein
LPRDNKINFHTGIEYYLFDVIALRVGYKSEVSNNKLGKFKNIPEGLTTGLGIRLGNIQFDYAYVPYGDLGNTHRISLLIRFGKREAYMSRWLTKNDENVIASSNVSVSPEQSEGDEAIPKDAIALPLARNDSNQKKLFSEELVKKEEDIKLLPTITQEILNELKPPESQEPTITTSVLEPTAIVPPFPPSPPSPPILAKPQKQVIVKVDSAVIYTDPNANYPILTKVNKGTKLLLLDSSKKWYYKVKLSNGRIGWISSFCVKR